MYTSALTVSLDYMHVKYLGCDQYMFGAVLEVLVSHVLPGSPADNLKTVWDALLGAYRMLGTPPSARYRYLNKLSMFMRAGYSKLRGKAGEIRHLGKALCKVWETLHDPTVQIHREILLMLRCNVAMESVIEEFRYRYALPPAPAEKFRQNCDAMLLIQAKIARFYAENGLQLFDLTSKCHLLQHLGILAAFISPRTTWCFSGEDFMKKSQTLAQSAVRGLPCTKVMGKMASKYRLALQLQFDEH